MSINKITQEEIDLIKSAQAGYMPAFNRIFYKYKDFVDNLLYTYIKDKDEAKDLTNVVFLKIYEKLSTFTDYSSFGGWIRILTKNTAIDYLRTVKDSTSLVEETFVSPAIYCENTELDAVDMMTYQKLLELIEEVAPSYRDTCLLFYKEGMSIAEISKALHVSKGTIKSRLHRMRKHLKNHLNLEHVDNSSSSCDCSISDTSNCTL